MSNNNQVNNAESFSIQQIVGDQLFFEIPPYQRLYEWEKEHIETLLEDVKKACFNAKGELQNKIYFIGSVVVCQQENKYILIDGQQRLTTLFLIGIYLASKGQGDWKKFVKNDKQIRISMPLRENEEKWLSDFIKKTRDKGFGEKLTAPNSIHEKILGGLKTIQTWFEQNFEDNQEKEGNFSTFLYNKVCFALVKLAEGTDLNQFFVRMNNRGKQLEKHEILKARLLGILQKGDTSGEWKKYAKIWDLCSDMDKYIFQSASDRNILNSSNDGSRNISNASEPSLLNILAKEDVKNNGIDTYENNGVERVKSIIDFPTFLLHVAKLERAKDIPINKDKLLESIVTLEQKEQKVLYLNDKDKVKEFIFAMLEYRILFDYFAIKRVVDENLSESGEYSIRRFNKNNTYYSIGGVVMEKLAMIQNYLRVARAGDKQNYHHWLTPFLKEVSGDNNIKEAVERICSAILKSEVDIEALNQIRQPDDFCVEFLEGLDRDLAYAQIEWKSEEESGSNINDSLLFVANWYLGENNGIKWKEEVKIDNWLQENLNQGTGTPHYWFYRLEYYLWKGDKMDKQSFDNKKFAKIKKNFHFRGLNSVEHIQPQSKAEGNWQDEQDAETRRIDCFGNLALISQSFNSSLSNQDTGDKILDLRKKINKDDVESLKLWLAYAKMESQKDNKKEWIYAIAEKHQNEMLEVLKASLKNNE